MSPSGPLSAAWKLVNETWASIRPDAAADALWTCTSVSKVVASPSASRSGEEPLRFGARSCHTASYSPALMAPKYWSKKLTTDGSTSPPGVCTSGSWAFGGATGASQGAEATEQVRPRQLERFDRATSGATAYAIPSASMRLASAI